MHLNSLASAIHKITRSVPTLASAGTETAMAALVNVTGMGMEYVLGREVPQISNSPLVFSALVGLLVLYLAPRVRRERSRWLISALFVLNSVAVVTVLWIRDPYYAEHVSRWVPFQGNKLGCLVAAFLAPDFFGGLVAIAAHSLTSVISFELFPEDMQKKIAFGEPVASLSFGLAGLLSLISRFRRIQIENKFRHLQVRTMAMQKVASTVLRIKDLMNTPLQSICFASAIQAEQKSCDEAALKSLQEAVKELNQLNALLDRYEELADWRGLDESR